jgi:ElaB/YqjD/DUF883 family membrane-anchored ribosome-binding protein
MSEPDHDRVGRDESEIPPASPAPNQLCIISRDPLQAFIGALNPALRAGEEFTIIVDRRRADSENAARPAIERRHRPSVDAKVKLDGFAIVPLSTTDAAPWIERLVDHQSADDDADADEREIRRILEFKRRRKGRVGPLVGVSVVVGVLLALAVMFTQMPAGKALVSRSRPAVLPGAERPSAERTTEPRMEAPAAAVAEIPAPLPQSRPSLPPAGRINRPPDVARTPTEAVSPPARPEPSPSPRPERRLPSSEPAPAAREESVSELPDTPPASVAEMTPPPTESHAVPSRPRAPSPQPSSPTAGAPEPARPPESHAPPSRPRSTPSPQPSSASASGTPRQSTARSLDTTLKSLEDIVTGDVNTAGEEAKRQAEELRAKTMQRVDEMRRVWNNTKRMFSGDDANRTTNEAAAGPRR